MRNAMLHLPLPLLILLTQTLRSDFALGLPAPSQADMSFLESYLDFNRNIARSPIALNPNLDLPAAAGLAVPYASLLTTSVPGDIDATGKSKSKTKRRLKLQIPFANTPSSIKDQDGSTEGKQECTPPILGKAETEKLRSALLLEMLAQHKNGIAFPYEANTRCSGSVEVTARTRILSQSSPPESKRAEIIAPFNAKLKLTLTPVGRDVHGMKRVQFVGLLGDIAEEGVGFGFVGGDEREEKEGEGERGVLEGVSGDVGFVVKFVVSPALDGRCV